MEIKKNYSAFSLIGSILNFYNLDKKTIYGSGVMDPDALITGKPEKIISVRGPETRKVLLRHGIDCPENYGDPALLLPCFYSANKIKKYKGGLILHKDTKAKDNMIIQQIINYLDLHVISIANYSEWTDVIDEICSCDYIISESLHGLIVSETYGVPNVWVEFIEHPDYWNFKYLDFYESINKDEKIIQLQKGIDLEYIETKINDWKKGNIDYKKLLDLYPFDLKISNEAFINSN